MKPGVSLRNNASAKYADSFDRIQCAEDRICIVHVDGFFALHEPIVMFQTSPVRAIRPA